MTGTSRSGVFIRKHNITANTHLIYALDGTLIEAHSRNGLEWFQCGDRAEVERGVAGWRAAVENGAWIDRPEDTLVPRALHRVKHFVELESGARIEARKRLVDGLEHRVDRARGLGQPHPPDQSIGNLRLAHPLPPRTRVNGPGGPMSHADPVRRKHRLEPNAGRPFLDVLPHVA